MSRISIDVTEEQHQRLKAIAALKGMSIKDYVLASTLGDPDETAALRELETLLDARIARTRTEGSSPDSVADVFREAREIHDRGDA